MNSLVTTASIHQETKDIRTEWAARHLLDLREICDRICVEVEDAYVGEPGYDTVDPKRWQLLVSYCESELARSPAVRAAIKLLDELGVTSNEAWDVAIDPDTPSHRHFHIAVSDEQKAWREYFANNPQGDEP